jgi:hypothetical protein
MKNQTKLAAYWLASGFIALVMQSTVSACSGNKQQDVRTAHDAIVLANDACVLLGDVTPDAGPVDKVCATAEELAPFANAILAGRARKAAASAGIPDASK